jgi:hypothetical protein
MQAPDRFAAFCRSEAECRVRLDVCLERGLHDPLVAAEEIRMKERTSSDPDAEAETSDPVAATSAPWTSLGRPSPIPTHHDADRPVSRAQGALAWSIVIAIAVVAALGFAFKWSFAG